MIFLNNRLVPAREAMISVYDHGFLYGDGIYETLRAYNGRVFMLEEHVNRLFRSAELISLDIGKSRGQIISAVRKTLKANRVKEAVIRITVSRGTGITGLDPDLCKRPTFIIMVHRFRRYPEVLYRTGVKLSLVKTRRNYKRALDPRIKSLNFLNNILARIESKNNGAFEALMLNYRGYLAECSVSNIFFVMDGTLYTPGKSAGILDGITRSLIIQCAKDLGIKVIEGLFRTEEIYGADEVFISNTTMEIMPVSNVDGIKIGTQKNIITRRLHEAYRAVVERSCQLERNQD